MMPTFPHERSWRMDFTYVSIASLAGSRSALAADATMAVDVSDEVALGLMAGAAAGVAGSVAQPQQSAPANKDGSSRLVVTSFMLIPLAAKTGRGRGFKGRV